MGAAEEAGFFQRTRKFFVGLVGGALTLVSQLPEDLVPDRYKPVVAIVISFLTALAVYLTPNEPTTPTSVVRRGGAVR